MKNEQFTRDFLLVAPNNKIPVIVDDLPADGGEPISIFESGAILLYLAEKTGRFLPKDLRGREAVIQWLFWQVAGQGPMSGQLGHFGHSAPPGNEYALKRYKGEASRLMAVLDRQLTDREFIAGEYSIADIACYPFAAAHEHLGLAMDDMPNVIRWLETVGGRPAVIRAYAVLKEHAPGEAPLELTEEFKRTYWGQSAESVRDAWRKAGL
jgi:GST-like protein